MKPKPMKRIVILVIITLALNKLSAQCDSLFFRKSGTFIYDLVLIDTSKIIGVGDNGYVIKSVDGGKNWKNIPTFHPYFLRGICAATDSVLYTVGSWQSILKSEDQGESWYPLYFKSISSPASMFFNDVFFHNKDKGFIVADEGKVISTTNGGISWKDTTFSSASSSRLNCVTFVNDTLGFICGGSNTMFRTKNGGTSWEKIDLDFLGFNRNIIKVRFLNTLVGFAVGGNGLFIKTTDGGNTWTSSSTPTGSGSNFYDVFFYNSQIGFIAGIYTEGVILKTLDGGNSWNVHFNGFESPSSCYALATDPAKKKIVFAGGGSSGDFLGHNGRSLISTIDSGASYQKLSSNARINYNDIFFLNDSTGYITGDGGKTYKTSDYGESWKPLHYIPSLLGNPARNIFFVDEQNGFGATDLIYKTNNGGATWNQVSVPGGQPQVSTTRMFFFDQMTGFVMDYNTIYRTTNAGDSWSPVLTSPGNSSFRDLCFTSNGKGFAVGYSGISFFSTDQGVSWNPVNLNTNEYLTSVYFFNNNIGFIGTADSILYKTTDAGANWTAINTGNLASMRSLFFINDSTGYMIRNNIGGIGSIYKTNNGGLTWVFVPGVSEAISRFSGATNIYTAGNNGFIYKTDRLTKPGIPGYIYGPSINCRNSSSNFITGLMEEVNYSWTLSGGGTNVFKKNLDTVSWNATGSYTLSVSVSNACGTGPARQTTLSVYEPTAINTQPVSKSSCAGTPVNFSVTASGSSISYRWKKNGTDIPGAINSTYSIPTIAVADAGNYSVDVTGLCGTVSSVNVGLTVLPVDSCVTAVTPVNPDITGAVLMPNYVQDKATLKIVARNTIKINWVVLDIQGRVVMHFMSQPVRGENYFDLSFAHLPAGNYFINGTAENKAVQLIKFVKL
jgi:photosystem II stability/assembly factor-like uncharacterized protein